MIINWISTRLKDSINMKICSYFRSRYEMIDVEPKQGMFNFSCFDNAADWVRRNKGHEIYEVVYIEDNYPILHYVNFNPKTNKYLETTLGYKAVNFEYYIFRKIHPNDYISIGCEFSLARKVYESDWLKWYHRLFGIKRVL